MLAPSIFWSFETSPPPGSLKDGQDLPHGMGGEGVTCGPPPNNPPPEGPGRNPGPKAVKRYLSCFKRFNLSDVSLVITGFACSLLPRAKCTAKHSYYDYCFKKNIFAKRMTEHYYKDFCYKILLQNVARNIIVLNNRICSSLINYITLLLAILLNHYCFQHPGLEFK